jgi:membrane-bound lytic murein transglycosylase D
VDKTHRVKKGESLTSIATRYGFSAQQLSKLNGLRKPYHVTVGKLLKLPTPPEEPAYATANVAISPSTTGKPATHESPSATQPLNEPNADAGAAMLVNSAVGVAPSDDDESPATAASERAEPKSEGEAEALGPTLVPGVQAAASADPADYSVHDGNLIYIESSESLSHLADWLEVTPAQLRKLNKLKANADVTIGRSLKLDLSHVSAAEFEARRTAYHKQLQEAFFAQFRIVGSDPHVMRKGESIWELCEKIYNVPIWLLRQYNPNVDLTGLKPGTMLVIPRVLQVNVAGGDTA